MLTSTKKVSDYQYLIVGGTTKAATTSLFAYLADHPSICAASYKETRFFLDTDYPLPSKFRFKGDVEEYNLLFSECDENQFRLESTPDYLYCPAALERMAKFLPHAKLIFSLREPISRLISWYRFAKQIGRLPQNMSFDGYIEELFNVVEAKPPDSGQVAYSQKEKTQPTKENADQETKDTKDNLGAEQYLQTLKQGCYATYLKHYLERFGKDRIYTLFYEDLAENPLKVLSDLCRFADIEPDYYEDYTFKVTNRTETMRSSGFHQKYRAFRFQMRRWTHNKPIIHKSLRVMRRAIEPLYLRLNTRSDEDVSVSEKAQSRLIDYYKQDVDDLRKLIGKQPPWQPFL